MGRTQAVLLVVAEYPAGESLCRIGSLVRAFQWEWASLGQGSPRVVVVSVVGLLAQFDYCWFGDGDEKNVNKRLVSRGLK